MVAATIGRAKSKRVATKQIFLKNLIDIIKKFFDFIVLYVLLFQSKRFF